MAIVIQAGVVGLEIRIEITDRSGRPVDISSSTGRALKIRNPAGAVADRTFDLVDSGVRGLGRYVTVSGDFPTSGYYDLQMVVTLGAQVYPSRVIRLRVLAGL